MLYEHSNLDMVAKIHGGIMTKLYNITVLGAGSWGTALAKTVAENGHKVTIWAYEPEVANSIQKNHKNPYYLTETELPATLSAYSDLKYALENAEIIVSVVPSHALRNVLKEASKFITKNSIIVSCTKGIEIETGELVSEIIEKSLPSIPKSNLTFLSGPSFAIEVAKNLPTSVVIAGTETKTTKIIQGIFRTNNFLTFTHNDVIGVEIGGAIKNVIAIATGASDGLGFGANSRAALITRGLYEMIKIGAKFGANPLTFTGLSGMGDLILTCTSTTSRNYSLGYELGQGKQLSEILGNMKMVAEGVKTSEAIYKIIKEKNITAPICTEVYNMLYKGKSPKQAAIDLTGLELQEELRTILVAGL